MIYNIYDEKSRLSGKMTKLIELATEISLSRELGASYSSDVPMEIDISVVDAQEMRRTNADFRGIDSVTDVLSFPQYPDKQAIIEDIQSQTGHELLLGDVVICYDKMLEQAAEYGTSEEREVIYLYVHSVMHLLGYDHIEDAERAVMREHEEAVMDEIRRITEKE